MQISDNFRIESCLQDEIILVIVSGSLGEGDLQKFGDILKKALEL